MQQRSLQQSAQEKYLETSLATASKEDLIVKVFDVLIVASQQALDKLYNDRDDLEGIHKALLRAQRAVTVLMGSLDLEIGGELAKNLLRVYEFWHHELVMANMQKDPVRVDRILGYAKNYRKTWAQAVTQFKAERKAAEQAAAAAAGGGKSSFAAVG
jgi:flagellar secretion chaperone FliS